MHIDTNWAFNWTSIFAIYFYTLEVLDIHLESICIIDVDVDHYKIILDYLMGVPSVAHINPIFFCNN